ncbi:hypothetical protein BJX76DRAFT_337289 [Aspergillus varians]
MRRRISLGIVESMAILAILAILAVEVRSYGINPSCCYLGRAGRSCRRRQDQAAPGSDLKWLSLLNKEVSLA